MSRDFIQRLPLAAVRGGDRLDLVATEEDRQAIANRLGLTGLERLEAHVTLERDGECIRARGRLRARVEQACVASGEPVPSSIDEAFDLRFIPEPEAGEGDEIELEDADCDTVFHDGRTIELGDALADTLALSLDPYPRSAGASAALKEAGVLSEAEASPFAILLRGKRGDGEDTSS